MTYKVFIDDSGFKEYRDEYNPINVQLPPDYKSAIDFWHNNYFVLSGIRVSQADLGLISGEIADLKKRFFGTEDVEVKSNWLRIPLEQKKHYLDKYPITPKQLRDFGEKFIDLIAAHDRQIKTFSVVFDKRRYKNRSGSSSAPLFKATQVLLERLHKSNFDGDSSIVVFDQMESKVNPKIGNHKNMLAIYTSNAGVDHIYVDEYKSISKVVFDSSATEPFLQVADVVAYNVFRQFCEFGRDWTDEDGNVTCYKYFGRLLCNTYCSPYPYHNSLIRGYGITLVPDFAKKSWSLPRECFIKKTP